MFILFNLHLFNISSDINDSLILAERASRERSADPERKDFCSEDTNLHHYKGRPHVQDRGAGGQEGAEEQLT